MTEESKRPPYVSPSPVKMLLFQNLDGKKTPIVDKPAKNLENDLKPEDCITPMQLHELPGATQLTEYE